MSNIVVKIVEKHQEETHLKNDPWPAAYITLDKMTSYGHVCEDVLASDYAYKSAVLRIYHRYLPELHVSE